MLNAKNGSVKVGNSEMEYISFGHGDKPLVMLPGLGDALKTVKGTALTFSIIYNFFAKDYTVYVFSRKNQLPLEYSIREMAEDQAKAMHSLKISNACVMGISQGGMIAMHLAGSHPELVEQLVLANTAAKCNETMECVVNNWLKLAEAADFKGLLIDTAENTYTESKLKKYRPMYSLIAALSKPKSLERFITQANACIRHDASDELRKIDCQTLVIGGDCDKIVGPQSSSELASQIANSRLIICKGYGHGAFEEYPYFNAQVLDFLKHKHTSSHLSGSL